MCGGVLSAVGMTLTVSPDSVFEAPSSCPVSTLSHRPAALSEPVMQPELLVGGGYKAMG